MPEVASFACLGLQILIALEILTGLLFGASFDTPKLVLITYPFLALIPALSLIARFRIRNRLMTLSRYVHVVGLAVQLAVISMIQILY